jgi:hypothetical protein
VTAPMRLTRAAEILSWDRSRRLDPVRLAVKMQLKPSYVADTSRRSRNQPLSRVLIHAGGGDRLQRSEAVKLSVALAQCGEFGFVLFAAAQARGLMSPSLTALASILITISMLATPFLVRYAARWADSLPQIRGQPEG